MYAIKNISIQIVVGFGLLTFFSCSSGDSTGNQSSGPAPVNIYMAMPSSKNEQVINASGHIEAIQTANISTRVMGFISRINVKAGDHITRGQVLVTISNQDIVAKIAQAEAMLSEAKAAFENARKDYERYTHLFNQQSASAKELDNITLQYNSARAKVEAATQMYNEAKVMLSYTNLTAPFSGVVTQKLADAGSMATPGMPILVVEQNGSYQVSAAIPETDIIKIKQGSNAMITIKSAHKTFHGVITQINPSSQASGGQYMIKITVPDRDKEGLYAGMYVNVSIPLQDASLSKTTDNAVLVPQSAIVNKDQLTGIYTISTSNTALLRWIRLGKVYGNEVEVISGLSKDEKFILSAEGKLYNGVPVMVIK